MPTTHTPSRPPDPSRTLPGRHWTADEATRTRLTRLDESHLDAVAARLIARAAASRATMLAARRSFGPTLGALLRDADFGFNVAGLNNTCLSPGRFFGALRLIHAGLPVTLLLAETSRRLTLLGYDVPQPAPSSWQDR